MVNETKRRFRASRFQLVSSFLILVVAFISTHNPASAADQDNPTAAQAAFKAGKAFYDKGQFPKAQEFLTKAAAAGSKNTVIQYYLGLAAAQNGDVQTVKRAMARIIIRNQANSPNAKQAMAMLHKYASGSQPYCCTNGANQTVRFVKSDMPIKIYITNGLMLPVDYRGATNLSPNLVALLRHGDAYTSRLQRDPNFTSSMRGDIMGGLQKWGWAHSEGLFSYQLVNSANDCDIIVFWCPDVGGGSLGGYTSSMNGGEGAKKVVMQIATGNPTRSTDPRHISDYTSWVGMHEFGHAFGICGHSPSSSDIMYKTPASYDAVPGAISENDRTTMRALYDIAPDARM